MQLNKFEREFRERIIKQPAELDLDQSWSALNERLDNEHLPRKKKSGLGRWSFGVLLCLLLGYCATGLWQNEESIVGLIDKASSSMPVENRFERSTASLIALDQPDEFERPFNTRNDVTQGIANVKTGIEGEEQNIDLVRKDDIGNIQNDVTSTATSLSISLEPSAALNNSPHEILIAKNNSSRSFVPQSAFKHFNEDADKEILANNSSDQLVPKTEFVRRSKSFVQLPSSATKLKFNYGVESTNNTMPIQVRKSERIGSIRSVRVAGGLSKIRGNYLSKNGELGNYVKHLNDHLKYLEAFKFSLLTNLSLAKNFEVGLGVQFQQINQVLEFSRISQARRTLENVVVEIRVNPYTQDSSFFTSDVLQEGQSFQSVRHYNAMTRWSVPLKFEYLNRQDRWGFGLAIGTSFSFSHVSRGRFIQIDGRVSNVQVRHPAKVHFLSLEPIITYDLGQPFVLDFRPHFQQAINNVAEVHSVLHRPQLWGVDIGIRYEWGSRGRRLQLEPRF